MSQVIRYEEIYIEELNEAASTRYELNEIHHKEMNTAVKLFADAFGQNRKDLIFVKNSLFYKGGYPSENTPPRLETLVKQMATIVKYFQYSGKMHELDPYLSQYGLKVSFEDSSFFDEIDVPVSQLDKKKINKIKQSYNALFHPENEDEVFSLNKKSIFTKVLDFMMDKQHVICAKADSIKLEAAEKIEEECDIKKPNFIKAVYLKYKTLKNGDISEELIKVDEQMDNMEAAISILRE